jgi:hypothetical protein
MAAANSASTAASGRVEDQPGAPTQQGGQRRGDDPGGEQGPDLGQPVTERQPLAHQGGGGAVTDRQGGADFGGAAVPSVTGPVLAFLGEFAIAAPVGQLGDRSEAAGRGGGFGPGRATDLIDQCPVGHRVVEHAFDHPRPDRPAATTQRAPTANLWIKPRLCTTDVKFADLTVAHAISTRPL